MDSILKMVLDGNWTDMTKHTEKIASEKIQAKIAAKKEEIVARLNSGYGENEPKDGE